MQMGQTIASQAGDFIRQNYGSTGPRGMTRTGSAESQHTQMTRDQWQWFLDTYKPVETDVLASAMSTDFSAQGDKAGQTAKQSIATAAGTAERNMGRAGATLTAEERSAVGRRRNLRSGRAVGSAENSTRRVLSDTRINLLSQLTGIGHNVANTAMAGMSSAAGMEAQRESSHLQQQSATRSGNLSMAASAAALMIAFV